MAYIWEAFFYPRKGEHHSPIDKLLSLCSPKEFAVVEEKLRAVRRLESWEWPSFVKQVQGTYQVTAGNFRVYFFIVENTLVVTHACRKVTQWTKSEDIKRAKTNYAAYLESLEGKR